MKIDSLETIPVGAGWKNWLFVRVHTDDGPTGLGEGTLNGFIKTTEAALRELEPLVIGQDPTKIHALSKRLMDSVSLDGGHIHRTAIAAITFLAIVPAARRMPSWREWLVGCAYAGSLVFYTLGNKRTTAANAIFLQSTAPLYILLLGPWLLHEKIRRRDLVFLATAAVGLSLFFLDIGAPQATAPEPFLGNLFSLASGLCWAFSLVGLRWLGARGQNAITRVTEVSSVLAHGAPASALEPLRATGVKLRVVG